MSASEPAPSRHLRALAALCLLAGALSTWAAWARYRTWHNETFDLAFYARLVWGLGHGDDFQPLTSSRLWGLHASPILLLLGRIVRHFPLVFSLLALQAFALCASALPLARLALRRLGHPAAAWLAALVFLLTPSVLTAATYEFHPGALALLPLAAALDLLDEGRLRAGVACLFAASFCREDAALCAGLTALCFALGPVSRRERAWGLTLFALGAAWFFYYLLVVAPPLLPRRGSLQLHFAHLEEGTSSPGGLLSAMLRHPARTLGGLATPERLRYLPRLLVPVGFLPLLRPRWLLPAAVPVGINLLSQFPSATQVHSHYALLAVPFLLAAAVHGACALRDRRAPARVLLAASLLTLGGALWMQRRAGATPLSRRFSLAPFRADARSAQLDALFARIPPRASVVAPDYALAHFADRDVLQRSVAWTRALPYVLLSVEHRARFAGRQELWRNLEETLPRNALDNPSYGLFEVTRDFLLFRQGEAPRAWARGRYVELAEEPALLPSPVSLGPSASLEAVRWEGARLWLYLRVLRPWPHDVGVDAGWGPLHPNGDRMDPARLHAELAFEGRLSPQHLRVGERVRTPLELPLEARREALSFGLRRSDGSRLDPEAPHWVEVAATAAP